MENLIVACIEQDLLVGRLDHKQQCLNLESAISRDIRPENVEDLKKRISALIQRTKDIKA